MPHRALSDSHSQFSVQRVGIETNHVRWGNVFASIMLSSVILPSSLYALCILSHILHSRSGRIAAARTAGAAGTAEYALSTIFNLHYAQVPALHVRCILTMYAHLRRRKYKNHAN